MLARLLSILALAALALQGAAPAMAAPMSGQGGFDHVWCGKNAPSAEAEAALLDVLEAVGKAPEPAAPHHSPACKFCCSAFAAPAALIPAPAGEVASAYAAPVRWTAPPVAAAPRARILSPHPARGPPSV